jgi:hypothetical protein
MELSGIHFEEEKKMELSVRTQERKANATGSQRKWTQLSLFLFYKQVLSFLCGSSHHITDREKDVYICICYLLTCVEGGDTPPPQITNLSRAFAPCSPAAEIF